MQWTEKYRPKCLNDIVGQRDTVKIIGKMMNNGGLPNLLFHGPPGTGKTATAYAIAEQLLGEDMNQNFLEINASDDRSLEKIRNKAIRVVRYMPLNPTKPRIIFMEEADGLYRDTQEGLRKPLEKSGRTIFIFAANDREKFITPILSRLMEFTFTPLKDKDIQKRLQAISKAERIKIKSDILTRIAKESEGDIRHAINELQKEAMLL